MSKSIFREGGALNIRRVSRDTYRASISLDPDADGLLARSCSDSQCAPGYFKVKPGTGITSPQEVAYCPYCAKPAPPNDFATPRQIEYGQALMLEEAKVGMNRMFRDAFGLGPSGRRKLLDGFISVEMRMDPIRRRRVQRPIEEELRRDLTCPHCGLVHAVFGLASTCPDCGRDIFLTHVREELQVVAKILAAVPDRRAALGARVAARDVENALEDVVSIFETTMKLVTRKLLLARGEQHDVIAGIIREKVKAKFQSIRLGGQMYNDIIGADPFDCLSKAEKDALEQTFEKRHPITHNLGVVDRKYLERASCGAVEGREVRVTPEEILMAITLVDRVVSTAYPSDGAASAPPFVSDDVGHQESASQSTARFAGLSTDARAIAEYLVKKSESGLARDPTVDLDMLATTLEIDTDALRTACKELEDLGWVLLEDLPGAERVSALDELFESCDAEWMGWDVAKDASTLARMTTENDALVVPEAAAKLAWSARRMNPALQLLIAHEAVEHSECYSHPFLTHWIRQNNATRQLLGLES